MMAVNENSFKDILEERRLGSDAYFAARPWHPVAAYTPSNKSDASSIKMMVLRSPRLRYVIQKVSEVRSASGEELYQEAWDILQEISYNRELPVLRWLALFISKILKRVCSSMNVNEHTLLQIKSKMGKNPVLFVPSHRSYGDFILLSYICFHYEIDIPRIAAGMDFQGMAIMGQILRDACAFFMRRTFGNDELYSATFSEYVHTLVTHGDAAVEFYIEGTRSRTGKALTPKFGFLSMALKPFFVGLVPDISVVPVAFSYDRCLEETLFAYELLGVPKPKETTKGLFKAMKILKDDYGKVFANFGEPISVKEYCKDHVDRSIHGFGPVVLQDLTSDESREVIALAYTIVDRQTQLTVLTCFNVIAVLVNNCIVSGHPRCLIKNLIADLPWISGVLRSLGAIVDVEENNIATSVRDCLLLHKSLLTVDGEEVRLIANKIHSALPDGTHLRGHNLAPATMDTAISFIMLQHYINPCAHHFIHNVFFVFALRAAAPSTLTKNELYKEYEWLRKIFAHEFVFYYEDTPEAFELSFKQSLDLQIICSGDKISLGTNSKLQEFFINFLASFLPGYVSFVDVLLAQDPFLPLSESVLLKCAQREVELRLKNGEICHQANLSLDLLTNCLHSLAATGAVIKVKSKDSVNYLVNDSIMNHTKQKLGAYEAQLRKSMFASIASKL